MRKLITYALIVSMAVSLAGCAEQKVIDGRTYQPYGILNENEQKKPEIEYRLSLGSVIVSIIFVETVIIPLFTIGFFLFEPVQKKVPEKQP